MDAKPENLDDLVEAPLLECFLLGHVYDVEERYRHFVHGDLHPLVPNAWWCALCLAHHELAVLHPGFAACIGTPEFLAQQREKSRRLMAKFSASIFRPADALSIFGKDSP